MVTQLSKAIIRRRSIQLLIGFPALIYFLRTRVFPLPSYQSRAERNFRKYRFPSVEDRVKLYMGDWYYSPCEDVQRIQAVQGNGSTPIIFLNELNSKESLSRRSLGIRAEVEVSKLFYFSKLELKTCSSRKWPLGPYCSESLADFDQAMTSLAWDRRIPILLQFGDEEYTRGYNIDGSGLIYGPILPHIKKFRAARMKKDPRMDLIERIKQPHCNPMSQSDYQPIIWKLNARRHFRDLYLVPRNDIEWNKKLNKAVFRGAATGKGLLNHTVACNDLPRCHLVYTYANSELVDAKLTKLLNILPERIDGVGLLGPELSLRQMLQYKAIIILEGNDVSSGLKWALLSQSVVIMPRPKFTSWAMEEMLEPWVHYIPIETDLSNVEEMVEWMLQHQAEATRISRRASLWIKDLVFHPQSESDEREINREILRRYASYFQLS